MGRSHYMLGHNLLRNSYGLLRDNYLSNFLLLRDKNLLDLLLRNHNLLLGNENWLGRSSL